MAYDEQTWLNGTAGGTPISAERLTHMEDGIGRVSNAYLEGLEPNIITLRQFMNALVSKFAFSRLFGDKLLGAFGANVASGFQPFLVRQGPDFTWEFLIAPGVGLYVNDGVQDGIPFFNQIDVTVSVNPADATHDRIDLVGITGFDPVDGPGYGVVTGTPAVSPVPPAFGSDFRIIAELSVPANAPDNGTIHVANKTFLLRPDFGSTHFFAPSVANGQNVVTVTQGSGTITPSGAYAWVTLNRVSASPTSTATIWGEYPLTAGTAGEAGQVVVATFVDVFDPDYGAEFRGGDGLPIGHAVVKIGGVTQPYPYHIIMANGSSFGGPTVHFAEPDGTLLGIGETLTDGDRIEFQIDCYVVTD